MTHDGARGSGSYDAHAAIHQARGEFRKLGRNDLPAYPKDHDALVTLVECLRMRNG